MILKSGLSPCLTTPLVLEPLTYFFQALGVLYDEPDRASVAESHLKALCQGDMLVKDYFTQFRKWCVPFGWNEPALKSQFRFGLAETIKDMLVCYPCPETLEEIMTLAIRLDR